MGLGVEREPGGKRKDEALGKLSGIITHYGRSIREIVVGGETEKTSDVTLCILDFGRGLGRILREGMT